ncbi:hypothetical protein [Streptomyces sp. NPDC051183]|uniref:alpha/beta fold hydrolase n=1 Tax=unclassified Streptomyces TaxID=2593676 RepID=UPI00341803F9
MKPPQRPTTATGGFCVTGWDPAAPGLAERHTVIRYDLRDFGESAPPTGPMRTSPANQPRRRTS